MIKYIGGRYFNIVYSSLITAIALFVFYWIVQVTTACSFHTPSGSMIPTLLPDECGLVNKWKMGARIFNISDAINGKRFEIYRFPGYRGLERNDVIIFNFPYSNADDGCDSIMMNFRKYYCKRAVAVAGDTLEIRDCFYHVRGCPDTLGVTTEQHALQFYISEYSLEHPDSREWPSWMICCPRDSVIGWTIRDMGPFAIPGNGTNIHLTYRNWLLYRKYIEWETGKKLHWQDNVAIMDGVRVINYTFTENYCFAAGDHTIDSYDSRYFGLVPEKFIVGTAGVRWKSADRDRWFKSINQHPKP